MFSKDWFWLLIICLLIFFSRLGVADLTIVDEARNATCAWEMYTDGSWTYPTFNGELRADKPPLHYFFMASAYAIFGKSSFAARFFSALLGICTTFLIFYFAKRHLSRLTAIFAAGTMLASPLIVGQFHLATPDPYLVFFLTLAGILFYERWVLRKYFPWWPAYASLGLAVLSKGPIGIVLPAASIFFFLLISNNLKWQNIWLFRPVRGLLLILIIASPWFLLAHKATGGAFTQGFFIDHNFDRFTDTMEGHGNFPLLPFLVALIGLLPVCIFLPKAIHRSWCNRKSNSMEPFILSFGMTPLIFFSFSSTMLPNYISPALPFLALCAGLTLGRWVDQDFRMPVWAWVVILTLSLAIPFGIIFWFWEDTRLLKLMILWPLALFFPMGALGGIAFTLRKMRLHAVISILAGYALGLFLFFTIIFPIIDDQSPVGEIKKLVNNDQVIVQFRNMNQSLPFYLNRNIPKFKEEEELQRFLSGQSAKVMVVSQKRYDERLQTVEGLEKIFESRELFEGKTNTVYESKMKNENFTNPPNR